MMDNKCFLKFVAAFFAFALLLGNMGGSSVEAAARTGKSTLTLSYKLNKVKQSGTLSAGASFTMAKGESGSFTARSSSNVSFRSSNSKVVSVDKKGSFKAKKTGKAVITVKNKTIARKVTITVKKGWVTGFTLKGSSSLSVPLAGSVSRTYQVAGRGSYSTSVKVTSKGYGTYVKISTAKNRITFTGKKAARSIGKKITVATKGKTLKGAALTKTFTLKSVSRTSYLTRMSPSVSSVNLGYGESKDVKMTLSGKGSYKTGITAKSSNDALCTVKVVNGNQVRITNINQSADGKQKSAKITVTAKEKGQYGETFTSSISVALENERAGSHVDSVTISADEITLGNGESLELDVKVSGTGAFSEEFEVSCDNSLLCSADAQAAGKLRVTSLKTDDSESEEEYVNVTVTSTGTDKNGEKVSASLRVKLQEEIANYVSELELSDTDVSLEYGETIEIVAAVSGEGIYSGEVELDEAESDYCTVKVIDGNIIRITNTNRYSDNAQTETLTLFVHTVGADEDGLPLEASIDVTLEPSGILDYVTGIKPSDNNFTLEYGETKNITVNVEGVGSYSTEFEYDEDDNFYKVEKVDDRTISITNINIYEDEELEIEIRSIGTDQEGDEVSAILYVEMKGQPEEEEVDVED